MSYPTVAGKADFGTPYREAQSCLGPTFANSTYKFFLTGTSTPANVYQNGALTTPFSPTGVVTSDAYGRFPPIYLDTSVAYKVQFYDNTSTLRWTVDPYTALLSTVGTSSLSTHGVNIAPTGEVTIPAPATGGTGISLTLKAGTLGVTPLKITGTLPGNSALIVNSSATTGAQTATFAATNKPGTQASSPAGWLPITCDGVQYYTPIWHGNPFTPYTANPSAQGEVIVASSVTFTGTGLTTVVNGTATPSNWFSPAATNVGAGYYINITKTSGLSGLAFSAAQGSWTNITGAGLTISSNAQATITGTYQLSSSVTGTPVVAAGTISLSNNNGVQQPTYSGTTPLVLAGNGTATFNSVSTSSWYSPTTASVGSGYYVLITPTGGTSGYSFSAGTGAYTNITSGGLTISLSGSGSTGVPNVTGTYVIASDSGGVNQLATGNITLSGSVIHVYTTGTSATETIPTGSSTVFIEAWSGVSGGGGGGYNGTNAVGGGGGGGPSYVSSSYSATPGATMFYTVGAAGTGGSPHFPSPPATNGTAGGNSSVSSGTFSITTMTAVPGGPGISGDTTAAGGAAGTATGGNVNNKPGGAGGTGTTAGGGTAGAAGTYYGSPVHSGTPSAAGNNAGGAGDGSAGKNGSTGIVAFYYS